MRNFLELAYTPSVLELQERKGSGGLYEPLDAAADALSPQEVGLITSRDSFYMATVTENGWPYVQHKGGDRGFVKVTGPSSIGWIERSGNRQYLGTGNVNANGRIAMILVDYPSRTRLKLLGTATYHENPNEELIAALSGNGMRVDGAITVEVEATAWNCPKFITPRFTEDEVAAAVQPLQERIEELEAELAQLRGE